MNYIPGAVVSTGVLDGGLAEGSTGFARYSDEAYKADASVGGRNTRHRDRSPHVPDEVPPVRGGLN